MTVLIRTQAIDEQVDAFIFKKKMLESVLSTRQQQNFYNIVSIEMVSFQMFF